jgi:hypothetical protein
MPAPRGPKREVNDNGRRINFLSPTGYHGDPNIMKLVDTLVIPCTQFIETGTEAGSTVGYTARMYPHLECYTVETDPDTFNAASVHLANHTNIYQSQGHSLEWLQSVEAHDTPSLFWLDAHSHGWGCVVGGEVGIVLSRWQRGYILLDDFEVPGRDDFGFDWYESYGKLNWETVKADLTPEQLARINARYYPKYKSPYGTRGWMLIAFGDIPGVEISEFARLADN